MGADIHIYVEIRKNGIWELLEGNHFSDQWNDKNKKCSAPFDWRHYRMFAILAGVRGNNIHPIKEPTYELPNDASNVVKDDYIKWAGDAHSASFFTARELVEFDFSQDLRNCNQEAPTYSRNVLFEKRDVSDKYENPKTYYDFMDGPDTMFFKHIKELAELGNLDDVRIVFWFDN